MLLYGNITAESCLFVEHEPENYSSEINKYQMELITAVHEAKTVLIEDIAFANGDKKIVTEALKDFAKTVKKYWDRFWAWVKSVFERWIKHINDLFNKPSVTELIDKTADLLEDDSKRPILASFVYRAPSVNLHRNLAVILNRGFNPAVRKFIEPLDDIDNWSDSVLAGVENPERITSSIENVTKTLEKDAVFIDSEKPVREVRYEDVRVLLSNLVDFPTRIKAYQNSIQSFKLNSLFTGQDWARYEGIDQTYPEIMDVLQALSFAIQKHLEKINAETERAIADYGKLLSSWYPAAMKRIYEEEYA